MERILVVEDSPEIASLMSLTLRMEGYGVVTASTGARALQLIAADKPSLILMDVMMPGLTGFQVAEQLKGDDATRDIPIIFVTARHEVDDRVQGLEVAVDYISKPFAVPELLARVRAALRMQKLQSELKASNDQLSKLAITDPLTGLYNRRGFDAQLEDELHRARRFRQPLGLVVFDLDRFKSVNDSYGHAQGDMVLQSFAEALLNLSRRVDKVARFGGEEFAVLLPNTDEVGAKIFAEKVRIAVEDTPISCPSCGLGKTISVTVSGGVAVLVPSTGANNDGHVPLSITRLAEGLFEMADAHLYRAKQGGRNRIETQSANEVEVARFASAANP
ncbi:response regulator PleD [Abditibacteriota bacterium]|nr:response regulator PleD [Abditibacteriota bacterium]